MAYSIIMQDKIMQFLFVCFLTLHLLSTILWWNIVNYRQIFPKYNQKNFQQEITQYIYIYFFFPATYTLRIEYKKLWQVVPFQQYTITSLFWDEKKAMTKQYSNCGAIFWLKLYLMQPWESKITINLEFHVEDFLMTQL